MNHQYIQQGGDEQAKGRINQAQGANQPGGEQARGRTSQGANRQRGEKAIIQIIWPFI